MAYLWQILCNGLHNGALYALLAYSYVLLHQVVPKPNLAHGALFALAGQITVAGTNFAYNGLIFTFAASLGLGASVAALITLIALMVFAIIIVPRVVGASANMMIMATMALGIVYMEAFRIGADGRDFWLPPLNTFMVPLGLGAAITPIQLSNMGIILVMIAGAELILQKTSVGRAIRAVAQLPAMAALCGINVTRIYSGTAFASGLMSLVGGFLAVLYLGNMSFGAGLTYGLKVLFIAAAGGFSTPLIAALAAFAYGEAEAIWDGYMPIIWRDAFFFTVLSILLIIKGRENRAAL